MILYIKDIYNSNRKVIHIILYTGNTYVLHFSNLTKLKIRVSWCSVPFPELIVPLWMAIPGSNVLVAIGEVNEALPVGGIVEHVIVVIVIGTVLPLFPWPPDLILTSITWPGQDVTIATSSNNVEAVA